MNYQNICNGTKNIAMDLGYQDPAYFCRFFRKMTQRSTKDFRKQVFK